MSTHIKNSRRKRLARAGWYVCTAMALGIFMLYAPAYMMASAEDLHGSLATPEPSLLMSASNIASFLTQTAAGLISLVLASVLFLKRPNDGMALFLSYFLLVYAVVPAGPLAFLEPFWPGVRAFAWSVIQPILLAPFLIAFLSLFPNGRLVPYQTRWLVVVSSLYAPVSPLLLNANALSGSETLYVIGVLLWFALIFAGVYAQIYRYRHVSNPTERQQTKWVVYGFTLAILFVFVSSLGTLNRQRLAAETPLPPWAPLGSLGWSLAIAALPISLTFSVMRYRLYDIDILINKTLVYGALSGTLGLVYFSSVVLLQQVFPAESQISIVLSTLAIAALFSPLRRRIQNAIDKRFYRQKYDAQRTLAAFSARMRDEVELEKLSEALLAVVEETMQPTHVSLWLEETER